MNFSCLNFKIDPCRVRTAQHIQQQQEKGFEELISQIVCFVRANLQEVYLGSQNSMETKDQTYGENKNQECVFISASVCQAYFYLQIMIFFFKISIYL